MVSIRYINTGIWCSSLLVLIRIIIGLFEWAQFNNKDITMILNISNAILFIMMLIILREVLVRNYSQSQLDWILKSMILLSAISVLPVIFKTNKVILAVIVALSFINLILSVIFINKIMDIEKSEVEQIEYLKNYSLTYIICIFCQLAIPLLTITSDINITYINHFLLAVPFTFIVLFFMKVKTAQSED